MGGWGQAFKIDCG